jgi:hypothetical protein
MANSAIARAFRSQTRNGITGISSETRLDLLRDDRLMPPRPSPDLGYRVARSGGQIQLSEFISTALFLLSNKLHHREDGDEGLGLLCSLLDLDTSLTTMLLQISVPSLRATWESLFEFSLRNRRRHTFRALASIGIQKTWLNPRRLAQPLFHAVEMDCYDIVARIVAYCCDSGCSDWWEGSLHVILQACKKGNVDCADLLIQHCNVNAPLIRTCGHERVRMSMFRELIIELENGRDETALALELFLANGANVDEKSSRVLVTRPWSQLVGGDKSFAATQLEPTILDEVYYLSRPFFDKVHSYSRAPVSQITRAGLLIASETSSQTLRDYLSSRQSVLSPLSWRQIQSILELLLVEQFMVPKKVDLRIVQGFLEFDVDFKMPSVGADFRDFWRTENDCDKTYLWTSYNPKIRYHDFSWHQFSNESERTGLLNMLLTKGGVIGELVLEGAIAQYGISGLDGLAMSLKDFPAKALRALARAARSNDFQAVEFLLRNGVDPNAMIHAAGRRYSIPAIAIQAQPFCELPKETQGGCSVEMLQLLVRRGARLIVGPEDSTPFAFADYLLRQVGLPNLLAMTKYVLGILTEDKNSPRLPSFLLESCFSADHSFAELDTRLKVFEYLFRQGAEVSPGSPLGALIWAGGRTGLVRDVIHAGPDLNAYFYGDFFAEVVSVCTPLQAAARQGDEALIRILLQKGANVNSPPGGRDGETALQAMCGWFPATEEEHQRKMRLCCLLIDQGADIHASPSYEGHMPLASAAFLGHLELAALLLREGADVNASFKGAEYVVTALDEAAHHGRLDMAKFLLNANGLSANRGDTGYDGAISSAKEQGHFSIAYLIREHAAKVGAGVIFNPELLTPQKDYRIYGYTSYDSSSLDADSEYRSDTEGEDDLVEAGRDI